MFEWTMAKSSLQYCIDFDDVQLLRQGIGGFIRGDMKLRFLIVFNI